MTSPRFIEDLNMNHEIKSLDLHGERHEKARSLVEKFFYVEEPPFEVITGNSVVMMGMVNDLCREFEYDSFHRHPNNLGSVIIIEGL